MTKQQFKKYVKNNITTKNTPFGISYGVRYKGYGFFCGDTKEQAIEMLTDEKSSSFRMAYSDFKEADKRGL